MELTIGLRPFIEIARRTANREICPDIGRVTCQPLGPVAAEAIGTFILVFAGCGAIAVGTLPRTGIAAGVRACDHGFDLRPSATSAGRTSIPRSLPRSRSAMFTPT